MIDAINKFAMVIGYIVIVAGIVGATVNGMNFHVIFSSDEHAIKSHREMADKVEKRIGDKK